MTDVRRCTYRSIIKGVCHPPNWSTVRKCTTTWAERERLTQRVGIRARNFEPSTRPFEARRNPPIGLEPVGMRAVPGRVVIWLS